MKKLFHPKLFTVIKEGYTKSMFQNDLLSGIIVGIVALPLAIAFGVASGVSPEKGLITGIVAGFLISFFGGSRVQIGGPTGAFIIIVVGIVEKYGYEGLAISTVLAGLMLISFGIFRLGAVLKFIPHPLIVGFTSGIAVIIFSTQIKDALGFNATKVPSEFISKWDFYLHQLTTTNLYALALTIATILITVYFKRITQKVPGSFVAIILLTLIAVIAKLPVTTIGTIFGEIKGNITLSNPFTDLSNIQMYIAPAFTIAMLGAIESLLSAVVADGMTGGNHRSNTELIAQGIANIAVPFFGGIPATGAIARTATNIKNGGKTPIAGIIHAVTLLLIMLIFAKWASLIPMSVLAGILIVVAYNMSEWRSFISIFKASFYDIIILVTTFLLTVLVDLTVAIEIGMVMAALLFMQRMSKLSKINLSGVADEKPEDYKNLPVGLTIYEISGPFFFGASKTFAETLRDVSPETKVLIIRMRYVPFIDATGIHNFKSSLSDLHNRNIKIILSGVNPEVYAELEKNRIAFLVGKANIFPIFDQALEKALTLFTK